MRQYVRNIYGAVWTVVLGMRITLKELFAPPVTLLYPDTRPNIPDGFRGRLHNAIEDCVVCDACARICPVDCIYIDSEDAPKGMVFAETSGGVAVKRNASRFDIDMSLCCYCGLCTEVCPTECLTMTKDFEYSTYDRSDLIYRFAKPWGAPQPAKPKSKGKKGEQAAA